jgi:hypothetical protein
MMSQYEVKTIKWVEEDRATEVTVMMVRFDVGRNRVLEDAGYTDGSIMFLSIEPGAFTAHWKPRVFARNCGATRIKEFCVQMQEFKDGTEPVSWANIEDGDVLSPDIYDR